jgi:murein DD-endopeptidase MepM/ murein hydrolase activator NlpD
MAGELFEFFPHRPVDEYDAVITSGFGMRTCPDGTKEFHNGVDIATPRNKNVQIYNVWPGIIAEFGFNDGKGWHVWIQDTLNFDNPHYSVYMHMDRLGAWLTKGGRVNQGDPIGIMGNTGMSRGIHLHYSITPYIGLVGDPQNRYLGAYGIDEVIALYGVDK